MAKPHDQGAVMSWAEVGRRCGMSASNARKVGNTALLKLRDNFSKIGIYTEDDLISESRDTPDLPPLALAVIRVLGELPEPDDAA